MWRPVDIFQVHAQSPSLLGGRRTGVMEDVLETYAALGDKSGDRMRAFLSLVYSHITIFSCLFASNSSKPTSGSISRPICSHGQLGRGNQRSTYVSGLLDSWIRWVHRCTSTIWTEIRINPFLFKKSKLESRCTDDIPPPVRYSRRKRKCRRWSQRSREYRRRRSTSRNRIRRRSRHISK